MYYILISNAGMGICNSPATACHWLDRNPVIELKSFWNIEDAYRVGCLEFAKRRLELGKTQAAPIPTLDQFINKDRFFNYPDMGYPSYFEGNVIPRARLFVYFSTMSFGIFTTAKAVESVLVKEMVPARVLEVNSISAAQEKIIYWFKLAVGAVSAYLAQNVCWPQGVSFRVDVLYRLPQISLLPAGQEMWNNHMIQSLPDIDHTPLEVMVFSPDRKS